MHGLAGVFSVLSQEFFSSKGDEEKLNYSGAPCAVVFVRVRELFIDVSRGCPTTQPNRRATGREAGIMTTEPTLGVSFG
jgi:hypothetical protein